MKLQLMFEYKNNIQHWNPLNNWTEGVLDFWNECTMQLDRKCVYMNVFDEFQELIAVFHRDNSGRIIKII